MQLEQYKRPGLHSDDIVEHLDTLTRYADECDHVTEMGFRVGTSFCALLAAEPKKLITYDIKIDDVYINNFKKLACDKTECVFHEKSTLDVEIEETDLLFIDTLHTYTQLKQELKLHGNKSRKYLIFHDTVTYGNYGEDHQTPGLKLAIEEFLMDNPQWKMHAHYYNCNGLTVIKRTC